MIPPTCDLRTHVIDPSEVDLEGKYGWTLLVDARPFLASHIKVYWQPCTPILGPVPGVSAYDDIELGV